MTQADRIRFGKCVKQLRLANELTQAAVGRHAQRNEMPMQMGDVAATLASTDVLAAPTEFRPSAPVAVGVRRFVEWYRDYYRR
jgi:UDP-glucuronate 4-epimerase